MLQIPPIPEMPEALRGRQLVVVEAAFLGDEQAGRELLGPLRDLAPELDTFAMVPSPPRSRSSTRTRPARFRDAARAGC